MNAACSSITSARYGHAWTRYAPARPPRLLVASLTLASHILLQVGKFDPVTRKPLDVPQLIPNLALKEAIATYLEANPWAYESDPAL